jgi:hypothetical protein
MAYLRSGHLTDAQFEGSEKTPDSEKAVARNETRSEKFWLRNRFADDRA